MHGCSSEGWLVLARKGCVGHRHAMQWSESQRSGLRMDRRVFVTRAESRVPSTLVSLIH